MNDIGIRELRNGFSRHFADVRRGKTVTITRHGEPIARIVPIGEQTVLERLIAEGKVRPAKRTAPVPSGDGRAGIAFRGGS